MAEYGFVITTQGWELLAKAASGGNKLVIDHVEFGEGAISESSEERSPELFTRLVAPVAVGTLSQPVITTNEDDNGVVLQKTVSFICEYRSDFNIEGQTAPAGLPWPSEVERDFYIKEFGVYAHIEGIDENGDSYPNFPVLIYYATLGATPHPVTSYSKGAIDVRRYPVSIIISANAEVTLSQLPLAFVTYEEMEEYIENHHRDHCMPDVNEAIANHNVSPEAHPDIRSLVSANKLQIENILAIIGGNAVSFHEFFEQYSSSVLQHGVYNGSSLRIEF